MLVSLYQRYGAGEWMEKPLFPDHVRGLATFGEDVRGHGQFVFPRH